MTLVAIFRHRESTRRHMTPLYQQSWVMSCIHFHRLKQLSNRSISFKNGCKDCSAVDFNRSCDIGFQFHRENEYAQPKIAAEDVLRHLVESTVEFVFASCTVNWTMELNQLRCGNELWRWVCDLRIVGSRPL